MSDQSLNIIKSHTDKLFDLTDYFVHIFVRLIQQQMLPVIIDMNIKIKTKAKSYKQTKETGTPEELPQKNPISICFKVRLSEELIKLKIQ